MRKLFFTCFITATTITSGWAQTLFHYGKNPVDKKDFLRIYEKNSINKKPDYSEKALREYLELYSLFRMKVKEAEEAHLDTMANIESELNNYRKQLAKNYLTDEQISEKLYKEAYDRMSEDIRVAHILILSAPTATSADTVKPYAQIDSVYNALVKKKADFGEMAKKYSEDKGSNINGGDIGYITALQTVYDFENVAYNTPVGTVSKPFRTRFGYHLLKVLDRRKSMGEIKVAQILLTTPKSKGEEGIAEAKEKIKKIKAEMKKGASFEDMVTKYSEDKFSKDNKGELDKFGTGNMVPVFEKAAFALKNPGDISEPVQTDYGFHIIKLIQKYPLKSYEDMKGQIKKKVDNDSRSDLAKEIFFNAIKEKNNFKGYEENLDAIVKKIGDNNQTFEVSDFASFNKPVFEVKGKKYLQSDLATYAFSLTRGRIMGPVDRFVTDVYKHYIRTVVQDVEEHNLVEEHPDFKALMDEYRDGIMLFELMDRNVWGRASKDSVGLKAFYYRNTDKYKWDAGFRGAQYKFKNDEALKKGLKALAKKNVTDEDVLKAVNGEDMPDGVLIERGYYEFKTITDFTFADITPNKPTKAIKNADGSYVVAVASEKFDAPTNKTLEEARGYVVADYQEYLESKWNKKLRDKYPVKVNEEEFKSMVK
ncbi:MAG: peptidylprolyl isomerase [Flavipsychrobacter sp.]